MKYFKDGTWDPSDADGLCSDRDCPCPEVKIPRGKGYLYVSQKVADLRRRYRSDKKALAAMQRTIKPTIESLLELPTVSSASGFVRIGPILMCRQGARRRKLDLKIAAADAKHWWETGKVPLRATPLTGSEEAKREKIERGLTSSSKPKTEKKWWHFWK